MIGIEDIISDRLRAAAYWDDTASLEWATQLVAANWSELDWGYLSELAAREEPKYNTVSDDCRRLAQGMLADLRSEQRTPGFCRRESR